MEITRSYTEFLIYTLLNQNWLIYHPEILAACQHDFLLHKSLYVYDSYCRSTKADTQHAWKVLLYHTAYEIFYLILQIWLSSMIFCGTPGLSKPSSLKFDTSHPPVTSFYLIQSRVHIAQFVPCVHKPHIFSNILIYRCFFARSI